MHVRHAFPLCRSNLAKAAVRGFTSSAPVSARLAETPSACKIKSILGGSVQCREQRLPGSSVERSAEQHAQIRRRGVDAVEWFARLATADLNRAPMQAKETCPCKTSMVPKDKTKTTEATESKTVKKKQ